MIYKQTRIGKHGKPFTLYKIRTMKDGVITRPFLRRTGLDELPQIWNILKGDMALFGPRPELPHLDAYYSRMIPEWCRRREVKPGLIGLAQVLGTVRGQDRHDLECKSEQARLDCMMIEGGIKIKLAVLVRLPVAMVRGQKV